ncbi:MAG: hypothetical protein JWM98_278 [Thermoleophilia bacterium]|nr:hypothetical protein [Thermoleophilia bacterium]
MSHPIESIHGPWPVAQTAAMVGADPARRAEHTVEGPTLHDRETEFGRGLASSDRSPTCFGRSSRASARSFGPGRFFSSRVRRAAVSGVAVLAFAVLASGCGAADPTALLNTGDEPATTAPATTPGSTVSDADQPTVNEISKADAKPGDLVKISAITPKKFAKAHCDKSILVVLYQPGADLDDALVAQAKLAAQGRKNLVTMMYTPSQVKQFGDLPSKLGLLSTPGVAIVDRSGRIETFWTSFVDYQLIGYQLDRAATAKPCKVGSEDVPAAGSALSDAAVVAGGGTVKDTTTTPLAGTPPGTPAIDAAAATPVV